MPRCAGIGLVALEARCRELESELSDTQDALHNTCQRVASLEAALREEHGGRNHEPECPLCVVLEGSTPSGGDKP